MSARGTIREAPSQDSRGMSLGPTSMSFSPVLTPRKLLGENSFLGKTFSLNFHGPSSPSSPSSLHQESPHIYHLPPLPRDKSHCLLTFAPLNSHFMSHLRSTRVPTCAIITRAGFGIIVLNLKWAPTHLNSVWRLYIIPAVKRRHLKIFKCKCFPTECGTADW